MRGLLPMLWEASKQQSSAAHLSSAALPDRTASIAVRPLYADFL
jgi:hypothetical protein